jgi:hypothetical protein
MSLNNITALGIDDVIAGPITLEEPFFIERYSNSSVEPQKPNTTFNTTGFGSGILNGIVKVPPDI